MTRHAALTHIRFVREQVGMQELHFITEDPRQLLVVDFERAWKVEQTEVVQFGADGQQHVLVAGTVRLTLVAVDRPVALPALLDERHCVERRAWDAHDRRQAEWKTRTVHTSVGRDRHSYAYRLRSRTRANI